MAIWEHLHTPPWELQHALPEHIRDACALIDQRNKEADQARAGGEGG
jgi:hypothetical protein